MCRSFIFHVKINCRSRRSGDIVIVFVNFLKGEVQQWDRGRSSINVKLRFQLETTIINYSLYFSFDVFKVYLSNIDSKTVEI